MPDFLKSTEDGAGLTHPLDVLFRLAAALILGAVVAGIYRRTREKTDISPSFPVTLVLLSVLIAMVTQVIGSKVARAFSLVGALSIVRFRTVVRDTQDTAYVIFAVAVGMAMGAKDLWVGLLGVAVVGFAAYLMMARAKVFSAAQPPFVLNVRVGLGHDLKQLLGPTLSAYFQDHDLVAMATARQGASLDVTFEGRMKSAADADQLVRSLNHIEGVQSVELRRRDFDSD
jgi:hypothetical protein